MLKYKEERDRSVLWGFLSSVVKYNRMDINSTLSGCVLSAAAQLEVCCLSTCERLRSVISSHDSWLCCGCCETVAVHHRQIYRRKHTPCLLLHWMCRLVPVVTLYVREKVECWMWWKFLIPRRVNETWNVFVAAVLTLNARLFLFI